MSRLALVAALFALVLFGTGNARADALSRDETTRLSRGDTVIREQTFERGERRYIGGVTYTIVEASAAELATMLDDIDAYRNVLPRTKHARFVGAEGADRFVELVQGNAIVEAEYTIRVRRVGNEIRFWLDPGYPHAIDDAWGFFRMQPFAGARGEARVLLTYAALVDVGPGIVRELFEERVRAALLSVPQRVRRYVAENRHAR
jgi:hypothetical protein